MPINLHNLRALNLFAVHRRPTNPPPMHPKNRMGRTRYTPPIPGVFPLNRHPLDYQHPSWFKHRAIDAVILWCCFGFPFMRRQRMRQKPIYKFLDEDTGEVIYFDDLQKYREATWKRRHFEEKVDGGVYRRWEFDPGDRAYADSLALQPHFLRMKNLLTMNTERGRASKYLMHRHQWNKYTHKDRPNVGHMMQPGWRQYAEPWQQKFLFPRDLLNRWIFGIPWRGDLSQRYRLQWGKTAAEASGDTWLERGNFPWFAYSDKIHRPQANWTKQKVHWNRRKWSLRGQLNHGQEGLDYLDEETRKKISWVGIRTGTGVGKDAPNPGMSIFWKGRPHGPLQFIKREVLGIPEDNSWYHKNDRAPVDIPGRAYGPMGYVARELKDIAPE